MISAKSLLKFLSLTVKVNFSKSLVKTRVGNSATIYSCTISIVTGLRLYWTLINLKRKIVCAIKTSNKCISYSMGMSKMIEYWLCLNSDYSESLQTSAPYQRK